MLACNNNCAVNLVLGDRSVEAGIVSTGDMLVFNVVDLGTIEITESGEQILQIRPSSESWSGLNLQKVYLQMKPPSPDQCNNLYRRQKMMIIFIDTGFGYGGSPARYLYCLCEAGNKRSMWFN